MDRASTCWQTPTIRNPATGRRQTGSESGNETSSWVRRNFFELANLRFGDGNELAWCRMLFLFARRHASDPGRRRSDDPQPFGHSSWTADSSRKAIARRRSELTSDAVLELEFPLEALAAQSEGRLRTRREVGLEVIEI
jgi:hypothetical protein